MALGVSEGELPEDLVVGREALDAAGTVRVVVGVVGHDGAVVEVDGEHEGVVQDPAHQRTGLRLATLEEVRPGFALVD